MHLVLIGSNILSTTIRFHNIINIVECKHCSSNFSKLTYSLTLLNLAVLKKLVIDLIEDTRKLYSNKFLKKISELFETSTKKIFKLEIKKRFFEDDDYAIMKKGFYNRYIYLYDMEELDLCIQNVDHEKFKDQVLNYKLEAN